MLIEMQFLALLSTSDCAVNICIIFSIFHSHQFKKAILPVTKCLKRIFGSSNMRCTSPLDAQLMQSGTF